MENILLYPDPATVFAEPALAMYFKPLLTVLGETPVHLLTRDGMIVKHEPAYQFAENYCFGFGLEAGKYRFLGSVDAFEASGKIPALYAQLHNDWQQNKDGYLKGKTPVKVYLEAHAALLDSEYASIYARSFYSFEFTRYYYQKFGVHRHVSVVTEGWAKTDDDFLLEGADAGDVLEECLGLIEEEGAVYPLNLSAGMIVAATESRRFAALSGSCFVMGLLDRENEILYMVEHAS